MRALAARGGDGAPAAAAARFHHSLYEVALTAAADDARAACELLPAHAKCWLRAGEALELLGALEAAGLHYREAAARDAELGERLAPTLERLELARAELARAREQGLPEDHVREILGL